MTTSEQLLREFDYEFPATRKFLALTPDDKLTWARCPLSMRSNHEPVLCHPAPTLIDVSS